MSNFAYVMIAGTIILVIGGVLAGFVGEDLDTNGDDETAAGNSIFAEYIGTIGEIDTTSRTPVRMRNVRIEHLPPNKTVIGPEDLTVASNLFGGQVETYTFEATAPQHLYIEFIAERTADPSYIEMTLNGEPLTIPDHRAGQAVTIATDDIETGTNVLQVRTKSPGAAFWKRPRYVFNGFSVTLDDLQHSRIIEPFRMFDYEIEGFDQGTLTFTVLEDVVRQNPLRIDINGNTIYEGTPVKRASSYQRTFFANTTGITAGENTISFHTTDPSVYSLATARIDIGFIAGNAQRTVTRDVDVSSAEYRRLGRNNIEGRMYYDVDRIVLDRPVDITLGNKTETVNPVPGRNTFTFDQDDVERGTNSLQFSTDGSYRLGTVNVTLVDTSDE